MIPSDQDTIAKLQELADRNIANGDWGDEVSIPGLPGESIPLTPDEREAKGIVLHILSKTGRFRIPKRDIKKRG